MQARDLANGIQEIDWKARKKIFYIFVVLNGLLNYDTGVIPASLLEIDKEMDLNYEEKAAIGSLVYLGICTATLIVPIVYQRYSAAQTLVLMISMNIGFCLLFSFTYNLFIMYFARFGMGFTQAFCLIYAPVWTNEFSPPHKATSWMGMLQAAVPLGIVLGYFVASMFINVLGSFFTWRLSVQLQAVMSIPLIISLAYADKNQVDIINTSEQKLINNTKDVRMDSIDLTKMSSFCDQLKLLAKNWVFILVTLCLCSLYFVVIGIQFWMTIYMVTVIGADPLSVLVAFVLICTTAPLSGVLLGGYATDYMGGYKGENMVLAVKLCVGFGFFSCAFTLPLMLVTNFWGVAALLWFLLFFGGCLIPTAIGINVNSLQKEYQSTASSVSQLVFNLGGYFLSPIVSALVMDSFDDKVEGALWGFRFALMISFVGLFFIIAAWIAAYFQMKGFWAFEEGTSKLEAKEIQLEIIRRIGQPY